MWVLDGGKDSLFAYDLAGGEQLTEYALASANDDPHGLFFDGVTFWVSDHGEKRLFAYRLKAGEDGEDELERNRDEEFPNTVLSRAGNNSPRGIWSDGDVMYVADESDDKVYTYNMPDAIDARLASLTLGGIDFGEFDPGRIDYEGTAGEGVTETAVEASAVQRRAVVEIEPVDADGDEANGYQVALEGFSEITVTVTSADGSRRRSYRVVLGDPEREATPEPWTHCLRSDIAEGFSLVVYEGGSIEELALCARPLSPGPLQVAHVAQLRRLPRSLRVQPRLRIGARIMRVAAAPPPPEVDIRVAPARGWLLLVARAVALERGPGLQQRPVHGEVVGGEQPAAPGLGHHLSEEGVCDSGSEQALAVLGEGRGVERLV